MKFHAQKEALLASSTGRWFFARELKERQILTVAGICLVLLLIWVGLWQPVSQWYDAEHLRFARAQANLDWMRSHESEARSLSGSAANGQEGPIMSIVRKAADVNSVAIVRFQPEGESLTVSLQNQVFSDVMRWLQALQENNGMLIRSATIDRQDTPGYVNARITFQ